MGGKKKKSLANKLAKMSDEERARYLQHKAEIEEEAKRRKEQLISTFMKKKIKKEEAFARLNLAKINQNWHQILRKIKVKHMKNEVENLKKWIERLLEFKNNRIEKLLHELDEANEQYMNNFNSHSIHVEIIIENQSNYIDKLQSQYQDELDDLVKQANKEHRSIMDQSKTDTDFLKTVTYGQKTRAEKQLRDNWDSYSKRLYEEEYNNGAVLIRLRKTRGETEAALWKQILEVVRWYVEKTDIRRSHFQELQRIDSESAQEIQRNEEAIIKKEDLIKILTNDYNDLLKKKEDKIKSLEAEENLLQQRYFNIRNKLKAHLAVDEKQLRILTVYSNEALDHLNVLFIKGKRLLNLSKTCQKFETEREQVAKWLPIVDVASSIKSDASEKDSEEPVVGKGLTDDEKLYQKALEKGFPLEVEIGESKLAKKITRPKTSSCFKSQISPSDTLMNALAGKKYYSIERQEVEGRTQNNHENNDSNIKKNILDECYENLEKLENFWDIYNKAELDVVDLKHEKMDLEKENKQLRGLIRAVLEAAALSKTVPASRTSTRAQSKRRSAYSAPLKRIIF